MIGILLPWFFQAGRTPVLALLFPFTLGITSLSELDNADLETESILI